MALYICGLCGSIVNLHDAPTTIPDCFDCGGTLGRADLKSDRSRRASSYPGPIGFNALGSRSQTGSQALTIRGPIGLEEVTPPVESDETKVIVAYKIFCSTFAAIDWMKQNLVTFCRLTDGSNRLPNCIELNELYIPLFSSFLRLRPANTSKRLLIGCGNRPDPNEVPFEVDDHDHENFVTVDPSILMNPTVVGMFGASMGLLEAFDGHTFDLIVFEGVKRNNMGKCTDALLEQLLTKNGKIEER